MRPFQLVAFQLFLGVIAVSASHAQDDPARDGWQTEAFAAIASRELTSFAVAVRSEEPTAVVERYFRSEGVMASYLDADSVDRVVYPFRIFDESSEITETKNAFEVVTYLASAWAELRDAQFQFKIIGVAPEKAVVRTTVLVSADGRLNQRGGRSATLWEQHSEWTVVWGPSKDGRPRIAELHIRDQHSASLVASATDVPLLVERTSAVLGKTSSYQDQLAFGQPYWLRRIEAFHGMLNPGQNGIAVGDLNGDGLDDIYVCQPGGLPNRAYLHQPDGTLVDVLKGSGLDMLDNSHSALIVDLDNDGDQDVVLATAAALLFFENRFPHFLLRHANQDMSDAYSLASTDYDRDGDLDVYACGYFPNGADVHSFPIPVPYYDANNGGANRLLRNEGGWQFGDVTEAVGLGANNRRFSYAAVWIDLDNDGLDDLYVANDFGPDGVYGARRANQTVRFVDVSAKFGIQNGAFGMSAAAADINRDGYEDIYVANMYSSAGNRVTRQPRFQNGITGGQRGIFQRLANGNSLLLNRAGSALEDVGAISGTAMGRWSWGANFTDLNNDGWDDLLVTNGYISGETTQDL